MVKQMCWLSGEGIEAPKILYLRTEPNRPWQPYTNFPDCVVPDYQIPGSSKGYATYQKLKSEGWSLVPSL